MSYDRIAKLLVLGPMFLLSLMIFDTFIFDSFLPKLGGNIFVFYMIMVLFVLVTQLLGNVSHKDLLQLLFILGIALVPRLLVFGFYPPLEQLYQGEEGWYAVAGEWFSQHFDWFLRPTRKHWFEAFLKGGGINPEHPQFAKLLFGVAIYLFRNWHPLVASRLVSVIFSSANCVVLFLLVRKHLDNRIAFPSACYMSLLPSYFLVSCKGTLDPIALFFVLWSFWFLLEEGDSWLNLLFAGFMYGFCLGSRIGLGFLLFPAYVVFLISRRWRKSLVLSLLLFSSASFLSYTISSPYLWINPFDRHWEMIWRYLSFIDETVKFSIPLRIEIILTYLPLVPWIFLRHSEALFSSNDLLLFLWGAPFLAFYLLVNHHIEYLFLSTPAFSIMTCKLLLIIRTSFISLTRTNAP